MPALPAVARVVRCDFHHTLGGNTNILNRVFLQYAGVLSLVDAQTWINSIFTDWGNNVVAQQNVNLVLNLAVLTDLSSASSPQAQQSGAIAGTGGGAAAPAGIAAVVKQKLARRYRGGHPRHYISGLQASQIATPETLTAAYIALLVAGYNAFVSAALGHVPALAAPATEVNVSYFSGFHNVTFPSGRQHAVPTERAVPLVDTVIAHAVNPRVASQRRRNQQS